MTEANLGQHYEIPSGSLYSTNTGLSLSQLPIWKLLGECKSLPQLHVHAHVHVHVHVCPSTGIHYMHDCVFICKCLSNQKFLYRQTIGFMYKEYYPQATPMFSMSFS